ncbi:MAG: YdeI/OmpD-associated family protein, partial [Usitatibacteraceae bacterium]
ADARKTAMTQTPTFFKTAKAFRVWLGKNHARESELLLGFYRKDTGLGGITYPEAVDEALCFGWIDGVKKRLDDVSYTQRFTPRKPRSIWSLINVAHVERLTAAGRMSPSGIRAFEAREAARTGIYSFERETQVLDAAFEKTFRANRSAWKFWQSQPPGYRKVCLHWVMMAKQAATRERRLTALIEVSAAGTRLGVDKK